jgi:hypothetical protein
MRAFDAVALLAVGGALAVAAAEVAAVQLAMKATNIRAHLTMNSKPGLLTVTCKTQLVHS